MVVLAGDFAKVDHLEVGAHSRALALAGVHATPFLLDLHKHWNLAGDKGDRHSVNKSDMVEPEEGGQCSF